jgi:hypothetical protein
LKSIGNMSININQLPDGVYILKVVTPHKAYKFKLYQKRKVISCFQWKVVKF